MGALGNFTTLGILAALGLVLAGGPAQALNGVFKGAKSARVLVNEPDGAGTACGLSTNLMETAIERPLSATKLLIDPPGNPDFTLYVRVATVRTPGGDCVSSLTLKAANIEDVKFTFSRIKRSSLVILYERSELIVSPSAVHADAVGAGLDRIAQGFAGDYDLDTRW